MHKNEFDRFEEASYYDYTSHGDVMHIDENRVEIYGGGDFYDGDRHVEPEMVARVHALAEKYGKRVTEIYGEWQGWSEYTPEPGDVTVALWEDK